jgi:tryptophanyl-tRNA synthetase
MNKMNRSFASKSVTKIQFDEKYYQKTIREYGYDPFKFEPINFNLKTADINFLKKKFLCHHAGKVFSEHLEQGKKSIITTGVGLSGTPHMGTLAQILNIINLQRNNLWTQFVLGDLDSYNARNQPLDVLEGRVKKYRDFIIKLGYDAENNVLRFQSERPDILLRAFIISNSLRDIDFERTEEDLSYLYKERKIYLGIEFPVKMSILLMLADFIDLGMGEGYENVLVMLGIDEHKYVRLAKEIVTRMKIPMKLGGLYSRMIKGFNGYPKMSKTIPASAIYVDMTFEEIEDKIVDHEESYRSPMDSVVYQLMSLVSYYGAEELDELYYICEKRGREWKIAKRNYLEEQLIKIIEKWSK